MSNSEIVFPRSTQTVCVRMIDTTAVMRVISETLIEPVPKGHEFLNLTDVAFLIEHKASGKKVLFDLGIRKDYWKLPPFLQSRLARMIPSLRVDRDMSEILVDKGVSLSSISSIIWSHYHWDHTGNVTHFPGSTELVVGPGFKEAPNLLPGYPINPNGYLSADSFEGRTLRQINFDEGDLMIGHFRAHDFFGDGSFYLLDTPGHCIGHICGLARTTPDAESTFIFMGGDIAHFSGDIRPHPKLPLPDPVPEGVLDNDRANFPGPCPCSIFTDQHELINQGKAVGDPRTTPFYNVSAGPISSYVDPPVAQGSVDRLKAFDASSSVFVCLAHDGALLENLPVFNTSPESDLNDWKIRGWKEKCHWGWLNELPRDSQPGRKPIVEGYWRDGKLWKDAKEELLSMAANAT